MAKADDSCQIYVRVKDKERLEKLAKRGFRRPADQLTVLLNQAAESEGLDPETFERAEPTPTRPEPATADAT